VDRLAPEACGTLLGGRRAVSWYGKHTYNLWLCKSCGFAWPANRWARHRRRCSRIESCEACGGKYPCVKPECPRREKPRVVKKQVPGEAPTMAIVNSLKMQASRTKDGKWRIAAPWLKDAVYADTWEDAYWMAVRARHVG